MSRDTEPEQIVMSREVLEDLINRANTLVMALDTLDQIRRDLSVVAKNLAHYAGVRTEIHALLRKLNDLDPHRTPSRPPSNEAWAAFRKSSEFVSPAAKKSPPPLPKSRPGSKKDPGRY